MKPPMEASINSAGTRSRPVMLVALAALAMLALVALLPAATGDTIADQVLGQADFLHESPNTVDGASLSAPDFVAIDRKASPNHLYLADTANNRVLGWKNAASFTNGAAADSGDWSAGLLFQSHQRHQQWAAGIEYAVGSDRHRGGQQRQPLCC